MLLGGNATAQENAPPPPAEVRQQQPATPPPPANAQASQQKPETLPPSAPLQPTDSEAVFLDRLMMAESGGRADAKNPRSTALGPYQFLSSTFLDLMSRHFATATGDKTDVEILQLRTDHKTARDAALVYTRENAAFLIERGHEARAAHLRLAFLVGPGGAARVISAEPKTPVSQLLGAAVLEANPFMVGMTAEELIARSAREAAGVQLVTVPTARVKRAGVMGIRIRCNLGRASCRKWVALANKRQARRTASQAKASGPETKKP
jgi:hypothetical protein